WDVGSPLSLDSSVAASSGEFLLRTDANQAAFLSHRLRPEHQALRPWYVPTLFEALADPAGRGLRRWLRPEETAAMHAAGQKGEALLWLSRRAPKGEAVPGDPAGVPDPPGRDWFGLPAALPRGSTWSLCSTVGLTPAASCPPT